MKALKILWRVVQSQIFLAVLSVAVMVGCYAWMSYNQHKINADDRTIPTASQLQDGMKRLFEVNKRTETRWISEDLLVSGRRLGEGLGLGILGSVVLGIAMGCFKPIARFFYLPITLLAKIPPTAALAVFFVMVGTGLEMYVAMIAFGILPTMTEAIRLMVRDVPSENINKARTLGASRLEEIWNVIFGQIFPKIVDTIRLQIGPALVFLIAAEMVCGDLGVGYRIRLQSRLLDMSVVYPYIAFVTAFGFIADTCLRQLIKISCPWYVKKGRA